MCAGWPVFLLCEVRRKDIYTGVCTQQGRGAAHMLPTRQPAAFNYTNTLHLTTQTARECQAEILRAD